MNAEKNAIAIEGLNYAFGAGETAKQVLFDINLELAPGEFAIMTGPSGSGKTTLLSLVGALRRPQFGRLRAIGYDLGNLQGAELEDYRRRKVRIPITRGEQAGRAYTSRQCIAILR